MTVLVVDGERGIVKDQKTKAFVLHMALRCRNGPPISMLVLSSDGGPYSEILSTVVMLNCEQKELRMYHSNSD